jgi:magnesium and cobalt transporter
MPDPSRSPDAAPSLWRGIKQLLGASPPPTLREEIEDAIEEHAEDTPSANDLSHAERQMLTNLLDLSDRRVEQAAVPRADIISFDVERSFHDLVGVLAESGHSRLPVFEDSLDAVIGMIHVKDVYAALARHEAPLPATLLRPVLYVPTSMRVLDLLARMRQARTHMGIVIDEFGGTDGLVTIEDLVEQIVGDIEDEHDEEVAPQIVVMDDGWEADARVDLSELEAAVGAPLGGDDIDEDVDTLGGLIVALADRVPQAGEVVTHPAGWRFEVLASDGRRVERARVRMPVAS